MSIDAKVLTGRGSRVDDADQVVDQRLALGATAVLAHSDQEAMVLVQRWTDRGLRVPEDLAVVAYDDEMAQWCDPPLTAVRPPKNRIGKIAIEMVLARIDEGPRRPVHRLLLNPELVVRESSLTASPPR